jgi:hypothetical protein
VLQLTSEQTDLLITLLAEYSNLQIDYFTAVNDKPTYHDVRKKYNQILQLILSGIIKDD